MNLPPWRYPHIFRLWTQWLNEGVEHQLDRWLNKVFKQNKSFGKKDRAIYRELFFAAMRFGQLAHALEHAYRKNPGNWQEWDENWQPSDPIAPANFWYWVLLRSGIAAADPRELTDTDARRQFFTDQQESWGKAQTLSAEQLLWHGCRPQWSDALQQRQQQSGWSDQELQQFIAQSVIKAPTYIRPQRCTSAQLQKQLIAENIQTDIDTYGLRLKSALNTNTSEAFNAGKFELQDAASQALAATVSLKNDQTLWDVCAGAGGKTLAFAGMAPKAEIVATDNRDHALTELSKRVTRAQFDNVKHVVHDSCTPLDPTQQATTEFDWVFIDAPCTSSGTWRRSPDAKWRMGDLNELYDLQQRILANAALHTAPNGYLIYATCSWLTDENETQVSKFLAAHDAFKLVEQGLVGSPALDADTMFFAKLKRIS